MEVNIFTQIGFVVLVGLASKNAILIVEFAKQQQEAGVPRREATLEACRLRLRPILMTSFAFILGVVPLVIAEGAGAEMRRSLGTGRVQRHARRDVVRHLPDAGVLLRHPTLQPAKPPAAPPPPALTPEKHDLVAVPAPSAGGSENGDARCEVWNA